MCKRCLCIVCCKNVFGEDGSVGTCKDTNRAVLLSAKPCLLPRSKSWKIEYKQEYKESYVC